MKKILASIWLHRLLRWGIGAAFLYAGILKWRDPIGFSDSIATFHALPPQLINLAALALPPLEVFLGVLVILGIWTRQGLFGLGLLTAIFLFALAQALIRGLPVDCGCFGSGEPSLWGTWLAIGRDFIIFLLIIALYGQELSAGSGVDKNGKCST